MNQSYAELAQKVFDEILRVGCCDKEEHEQCDNNQVKVIESALKSAVEQERERCAKVAENFPNYPVFKIKRMNARYMTKEKQRRIAQAIRKGVQHDN